MAIVTKTRTYNTSDTLTATYYNQDRDEIIAGVNSIDNAQISPTAAIQESKIAFASGGHAHTGGSGGKRILATTSFDLTGLTPSQFVRVNAGGTALETATLLTGFKSFSWYVGQDPLTVATDKSMNPRASDDLTVSKLSAMVKVAPTGTDLILEIRKTTGTLIATLTILAGTYSASTTTIANPSISEGDYLQLDITQVGGGTPGSKLSATMDCSVV